MKIAVTAEGNNLNAKVDPRFGRCRYFIILDLEKNSVETIENSNAQFSGGAGVQSAQLMVSLGVKAVLTGNAGPHAFQALQAAGVQVITGVSGVVKDVIEKYKRGEYRPTQEPSVGSKFGSSRP